MQVRPANVPSLLRPPQVYDPQYTEEFNRQLRLYFNQLDGNLRQLLYGFNHYGSYYNTATQTAALANTAYPVEFDTTLTAFGVEVQGTPPTRITVDQGGVYNFQFSAQLDNLSVDTHHAHFWFRINGVDAAYSASKVVVSGTQDETVAAWNYMTRMAAGDYLELMWAVSNTNIVLLAEPAAAPVPAVPSVIGTMQYVWPNGAT